MKKYSGEEFIRTLTSEKGLPASHSQITIEGFAKRQDQDRASFMFSPGSTCTNWILIPQEVVGSIDYLGRRCCHDNTYDYIPFGYI
jgi:hypothetical protein